ncbi:MAG: hypothetical protein JSS11_01495 [Verrucomicrobia bacterium]|nr:hypothetical protein [Verrucomicrobiota bacterium]
MNWNDYEAVWKRQPLPKGAEADVSELRRSFETKSRKLEATIRVRDYTEAGAGLVVTVACGFIWAKHGSSWWPMGLIMALMLGLSGVFIRERLMARRWRVGPAASLLAKVEADLAVMRRQCRLAEKVWLWYLAPGVAALAIHLCLVVRDAAPGSVQRDPWLLTGRIFFYLSVILFTWWINWRTLRRRLRPRLAELEKLRDELRAEA